MEEEITSFWKKNKIFEKSVDQRPEDNAYTFYDGPPFIWDEERRFEIRCELDALFFHLYLGSQADWEGKRDSEMVLNKRDSEIASLRDSSTSPSGHLTTSLIQYLPTPRNAVEYIMETFPIVKRKDEKEYGQYRTKRRILEIYDAMTPIFETTYPSGNLAISPSAHSPLTTYHLLLTNPPTSSSLPTTLLTLATSNAISNSLPQTLPSSTPTPAPARSSAANRMQS